MDLYIRTPHDELPLDYVLAELERLAMRAKREDDRGLLIAARNRIWRRERGELWTAIGK